MNKIFILLSILYINTFAINIGTIISSNSSEQSTKISQDIKNLLYKYDIKLSNKSTNSSFTSITALLENKNDNFFAIVNKDAISYKNKLENDEDSITSIYNKIPAILALGKEQIHIFTSEDNIFDFELEKNYKVYCGELNSDSCVALDYIQKAYDFNLTYIKSSKESIFDDLKNKKIDLYISVKKAPYKEYINLTNVKLIDLPTNFKMEDMYESDEISSKEYSYIDGNIHVFSAQRVLITSLDDKKYKNLIQNIIKIILLNQEYLIKNNQTTWRDINFYKFDFKKFSLDAKRTIKNIEEKLKYKNALIF